MPRRGNYIAPVDEKVIGSRLRELRKRRGKTQAEVAAKLGLDQTLVSDYERGTVRLHGALVAGFAKALGTTADEILGLREIKQDGLIRNRRLLRRVQLVDQLPAPDQRALLRFLDALLERHQIGPARSRAHPAKHAR